MDYHEILPRLFVGSYPGSTEDIETLRRNGISAVLNLQTDSDVQHFKFDWDSLLARYKTCGIQLRRIPVRDFDTADLKDKLPACISALKDLIGSSHRVYLHCSAGTGRSPSVAIAYLCCCGWDLDAAAAHVEQCRPCAPNMEAIRLAMRASGK
ncbi:MAG: dual specificity protein phosphatase family protein [Candidatus Binatia bacterium]